MAMISIDGVDLPAPSKFKISTFDMDSEDTYRNELGELQRNRIRQGIYKIELEFNGKTSPDVHTIETAIAPVEFKVTFPTPIGKQTKIMYVGDRNGPEMVRNNKNNDDIRWNISFNLIEY